MCFCHHLNTNEKYKNVHAHNFKEHSHPFPRLPSAISLAVVQASSTGLCGSIKLSELQPKLHLHFYSLNIAVEPGPVATVLCFSLSFFCVSLRMSVCPLFVCLSSSLCNCPSYIIFLSLSALITHTDFYLYLLRGVQTPLREIL